MLESAISTLQEAHGAVALGVLGGLIVGIAFGWIAEASGFCLRSAVIETTAGRTAAKPFKLTQFVAAMFAAVAATQALVLGGVIDLSEAVPVASVLNIPALVIGGLAFGVGTILAGGCVSRLLVLGATGNLRSNVTLLIVAVAGYATLRGVLAYPRIAIEGVAPSEGVPALLSSALGVSPTLVAAVALAFISVVLIALVRRVGWKAVAIGFGVGGLVGAAWFVTGKLAYDEFEPIRPAALSFTAPIAETVQYLMIATGDTLRFSIALVSGVVIGAFVSAAISGRLGLQGFQTERAPIRYAAGGLLMGFGGVTALGCSVGQGLSGVSTLAIGPFIALAAIVVGARMALWLQARQVTPSVSPGSSTAVAAAE
ncbi:MAG: YeeE/YedE family protein [Pseudomonadota bacterium]